jgi:hypothetical protein
MTYLLTEERKKRLTEFLGECWHTYNGSSWVCLQEGCNAHTPEDKNRTFDTLQDAHDIFKKLEEVGKWSDFIIFNLKRESPEGVNILVNGVAGMVSEFTKWLFLDNHQRSCWLVAEFLEEEK